MPPTGGVVGSRETSTVAAARRPGYPIVMRALAVVLLIVAGCEATALPPAPVPPPTPPSPPPTVAAQPPATPTPTTEDRSRGIGLSRGAAWSCPFPREADAAKIDQAMIAVQVTVGPDGSALSAVVVSDPGYGFGAAARACVLARKYVPAWNRAGEPIVGSNVVNVRFTR